MKRINNLTRAALGVAFLFFQAAGFVWAHPGNTAADGCHFCRSNCEQWGYTPNTRHGHNGEACDPALGPIDPKYGGRPDQPVPTAIPNSPSPVPPTRVPPTMVPVTLAPTLTLVPTMTLNPVPTVAVVPTVTVEPTAAPTIEPTVVVSLEELDSEGLVEGLVDEVVSGEDEGEVGAAAAAAGLGTLGGLGYGVYRLGKKVVGWW